MKKISALILAAMLALSPLYCSAAPQDSQAIQITEAGQVADTSDTDSVASVTVLDDEEEFNLDNCDDPSDAFIQGMKDGSGLEEEMIRSHMGHVIALVAIVFGVPCLAIIAALVVILIYALKRNKRRNEIINKAIEHNYQLPEAFFTGQKANQEPGAPQRDSKKFYSAVTFISIGLALLIFGVSENIPFFQLCGCIPMCIGIGRMIGYFYVAPSPLPPHNQYPRGYYQPQRPQQPRGYYQPQQPQQPPCPPQQPQCPPQQPQQPQSPPPYNPGNRN